MRKNDLLIGAKNQMKITAAALNNDSLPEGRHQDHIVPGLLIIIGKKRRTWYVRYRGAGGKQKTDLLGYFVPNAPPRSDSLGLQEAREKARAVLERVEAGVPVVEAKPAHPKQGGMTLGELFDEYERMRTAKATAAQSGGGKKALKGMKTLPEAMRTVRRNLKDYLKLPAHDFSKADLRKVRDEIAKRAPQMSDRFMSYLGTIMKWAAQEDHVETNFVSDTLKVGPGLVRRERVLTADEMRAIWAACRGPFESANGAAYGRLVRFLLVMAQRKTEGAKLRYGDILNGRWKQKEDSNKSGREHWLALPPLALEQLGNGEAHKLCFAGEKGGVIGNFSQLKAELDKLSGVSGWRHHDLRRTASTHLQEQGFAPHIIDAVLNHAIPGVGGHYMHGALNEAKSGALAAWAKELDDILKRKPEIESSSTFN
ncbi:hypothetical protein CN128_24525 [Sinorhizobium meliloti]|uniref:tyrosine-type recombinase/integrase n=1 Tax=Rhizobium meliloti TaxID=382 RepID=UPI000FDACC9A|nr:integrase family protein [Sinorhizobium meliloti]MDX0139348.1 tyrosine-type recombinase/integrase [Sinorhizobium meliloti]MDX0382687.1 tyrosine-type recombinase/integrase [Sinorhizobium meliloti]RVM51425.1 hypothetical protein CN128_24525 [Sinorhizobium meliloti]